MDEDGDDRAGETPPALFHLHPPLPLFLLPNLKSTVLILFYPFLSPFILSLILHLLPISISPFLSILILSLIHPLIPPLILLTDNLS